MKGLLKGLGIAGLAVGLLAYPAAWALDRIAGTEVLVVTAADDASVETNRALWDGDRAGVPALYGIPSREPSRLVLKKAERVVKPAEDPSRTLYLLRKDDHPLQSVTLYYFALPATIGGIVAGVALLLLARRRGRRGAEAAPG